MRWFKIIPLTVLFSFCFGSALHAQEPVDEIAPLPTALSPERAAALGSLSPQFPSTHAAMPHRHHRNFFRQFHHALTPEDVALRESVRTLGTDPHRFVHFELKDHSVVTGAITSIGDEHFFVRTGILGSGHVISYRDLSSPPRQVAAVGTHLKVGLQWTGFVGACVILSPLVLVFYPLVMAGVIQD